MSEISLRDYLARLDQLAQAGSADEVLWHARHILQYYPKNVDAYRFIGRALVALGRWDEANATLRRVLSVLPNDKATHLLLSTAYERQKRSNEAIWHLERAFEQDPNDAYLIDELKRMYAEHRHIANPRIQFTTAAVARQNIRSRDFDRAIEALRAALKRTPQRGDLRLLLAEALWQRGSTIDAAETALDVLQMYPDSLEANKMLAILWLSEQRPSDARRHLNRVEAVDPYLALELVQGLPADGSSFVLPELDYQRRVQAEMVAEQPDWLQNIDLPVVEEDQSTSAIQASDLLERAFQDYKDDAQPVSTQQETSSAAEQSDEEWLSQLDSIEMSYQLNTSALQATTSPLAYDEEETVVEDEIPDLNAPIANDGSFAFDWSDDHTRQLSEDVPPQSAQPVVPSTVPLNDNSFKFETENHRDEDPFGWMNADTAPLGAGDAQSGEPAGESAGEDPLAWLRSSGIEVVDNAPTASAALQEVEDIVYDDPEIASEADPLNWLKDYGTEVVDSWEQEKSTAVTNAFSDDASADNISGEKSRFDTEIEEDFPMPDLDMIVDDWSEKPSTPGLLGNTRAPQTMPLTNLEGTSGAEGELANPLDEWELNERLLNESLGLESLVDSPSATSQESWNTDDEFSSILDAMPYPPPTSPLPSISDEDWEALEQASTSNPTSSQEIVMSDSQKSDLDWDDETPKESGEETGATGMLNWLNKNKDADSAEDEGNVAPTGDESTGSTGILSWLAQGDNPSYDVSAEQVSTADDPTGSTGILNWLSQNRPVPPTVPLGQANAEAEFSTENLNIPETPEWLDDLQSEDRITSAIQEETGATDILDWLGDAQVTEGTVPLSEPMSEGEVLPPDTDWLQELYEESQPPQEELPSTGEITWEEDLSWQAQASSDAPIGEWLATDALPDLPLTEPLVNTDMPLTGELTANEPTTSAEDSMAALSDWLQGEPQESLVADEAAAVSDWDPGATLTDAQELVTRPLDSAEDDSFAALADWLETGDLVENSVPADMPNAEDTASMSDQASMEAESALDEQAASFASTVETASDDWLSEEQPLSFDPLAEEQPVPDMPLAPEAEQASEQEPEAIAEEAQAEAVMVDEGAPVSPETSLESSGDEFTASLLDSGESQALPDWMGDVTGEATPAEAFASEPLALEADAEQSWLDEVEDEAETPQDEDATPDWLLAAAPVAAAGVIASTESHHDDDDAQPEIEGSWGFEAMDVTEDDGIPELEESMVVTDDVLETIQEEVSAEEVNEYYSAFEDLPGAEVEGAAEGSNAPDWLNAMVPGLDIDTAAGTTGIDDVLEEDLSEETADAAAAMPDDYEWLNEMVDEETKSDIIVPAVAAQAPRFVFSRPPRWLRRLLERRESTSQVQDDSDLPAWLR